LTDFSRWSRRSATKNETPGGTAIDVPGGTIVSGDGKKIKLPIGGGATVTFGNGSKADVPAGFTIEIIDEDTPLSDGVNIFFDNPFTDVQTARGTMTMWFGRIRAGCSTAQAQRHLAPTRR
jgi:hypothetical protein